MKSLNITDLISMDMEEYDKECVDKVEENPEYIKVQKKYNALLETLDVKTRLGIDDEVVRMETLVMDAAFNGGFKLAVRLILSSAMG